MSAMIVSGGSKCPGGGAIVLDSTSPAPVANGVRPVVDVCWSITLSVAATTSPLAGAAATIEI